MTEQFYYPYFSVRNAYPITPVERDLSAVRQAQLREQILQRELAVNLRQEEINKARAREYQEELRAKQRAHQVLNPSTLEAKIQSTYRQQMLENRLDDLKYNQHLKNIGKLEKERIYLDQQMEHIRQKSKQIGRKREQEQNELKIQQYQQQLLQKIQACRSTVKKQHKKSDIKKNRSTIEHKPSKKKSSLHYRQNIILNKKQSKADKNDKSQKKKQGKNNTFKFYPLQPEEQDIKIEDYRTIDVSNLDKKRPLYNRLNQLTKKKRNLSYIQSDRKQRITQVRPNSSFHNREISSKMGGRKSSREKKRKQSFLEVERESDLPSALKSKNDETQEYKIGQNYHQSSLRTRSGAMVGIKSNIQQIPISWRKEVERKQRMASIIIQKY